MLRPNHSSSPRHHHTQFSHRHLPPRLWQRPPKGLPVSFIHSAAKVIRVKRKSNRVTPLPKAKVLPGAPHKTSRSPSALKTPPPICLLCDTTLAPTPGPLHLLLFWARTHFPAPPGLAFPSPSESSQTLLRGAPSVRATSQNMEASTTWAGVPRPHGVCCFLLGLRCLPTAHVLDTGRLAGRRREAGTDCPVIFRASLRPWFHGCTEPGRVGHAAWPCGHIPSSATTMEGKTKGGEAQESLRKLPVTTLFLHRGSSPHSLPSSLLHFSLITQHVCSCMRAHTNTHTACACAHTCLTNLFTVALLLSESQLHMGRDFLFVCSLLFPRIYNSA